VPAVLAAACALMLAGAAYWAGPALASHTQESTFQDDDLLVYNTAAGTARTLDTLKALGVDRVRVSVFWRLIAPQPLSRTRPAFNASDSAAYPAGTWDRYDQVVRMAHARGIGVNFNVTDPAPLWATGRPPRADIGDTYQPSALEFGRFVRALATRYSGSYTTSAATTRTSAAARDCIPLLSGLPVSCQPSPLPPAPKPSPTPQPIPRVDYWSIWNEPDQAGWLTPQWVLIGGRYVEAAPAAYRGLVNAAFAGLQGTGHGQDTILIGDTAPGGLSGAGTTHSMKLLGFMRSLYCVDDRYRPLRGSAATARLCPSRPDARAFVAANPGLFQATGWAHHPYTDKLDQPPDRAPSDPDFASIANLGHLQAALGRLMGAYHFARSWPLYLTEFGFQTPPNPRGVSFARQEAYLNQSEFIAYSNPSVRTLSQFLLQDAPPQGRVSFQTGLEFIGGVAKLSLAAYRMPIFLPAPVVGRGHSLRVWGLVRSAHSPVRAAIQYAAAGRRPHFKTIAVASTGPRGYLDTRVSLPASGVLRLAYAAPGAPTIYSRSVNARVTG
jgi:hypothetical protein